MTDEARRERLAAALRANLRRRKAGAPIAPDAPAGLEDEPAGPADRPD